MKKLKFVILALITTVSFSACSWFGGGEEEVNVQYSEDVQEGISNLTKVKSASYDLTLSGKVESDNPDVDGFETMDLLLSFTGAYDNGDRANPKFSMELAVAGSADDGAEEKAYGELRLVGGSLYFVLSQLTDFAGEIPEGMVEPFIGKWWSVSLPPEYLSSFNTYSGEQSEMTPEEKELTELFESTKFLTDVEYRGEEDVNGVTSGHYKGTLDKEAIVNFVIASGKIMGTLNEQDIETTKESMTKGLEKIEMSGDIWIGKEDKIARKWQGNFAYEDSKAGLSVDFDVTYTVDNLNESVELEIPEGAEPFDILSLLMGGAALGGGLEGSFESTIPDLESLGSGYDGFEDLATDLEGLATDEEFLKSLEDLEALTEGFEDYDY